MEDYAQGNTVRDRVFNDISEIPDGSVIMDDGTVLVPVELQNAEFVQDENGFIISTQTGEVVAEIDESDDAYDYNPEHPAVSSLGGYYEDDDEGVSVQAGYDDDGFDYEDDNYEEYYDDVEYYDE